jgi:hypothetical protein
MDERRLLGLPGVVGMLVGLLLALPLTAQSAGRTTAVAYAPAIVVHCLTQHRVGAGITPIKSLPKFVTRLLPPGVTALVGIDQLFGPEADGVTFHMYRTAILYFFRTATLAQSGEARMVREFVFLKGLAPPPRRSDSRA